MIHATNAKSSSTQPGIGDKLTQFAETPSRRARPSSRGGNHGDRIKQARTEAGFTQDELADLIGVGMRQVQYYEADESDPYRKLAKIAEATGKPIAWLLRGDPEREPVTAEELAGLRSDLADVKAIAERVEGLLRRAEPRGGGASAGSRRG